MRPRLLLPILLATLTLLLGACHSAKVLVPPNLRPPTDTGNSLEQARKQLQQATPCCGSFADFSYETPLPWRPKKFELGPGSMVANLNGVRSYFLAFHLPADVKLPYRIALKSDLNGRWLHSSYLFAPTTVLLDAAFQPIDSKDVPLCEYMGWSSATTGAFGSVEVTSDKARYLVVYSSADQQAGDTYWEQSPAAFSAESPVRMASNGSFRIPHGPDGTIYVGLMNESYAKAVENGICDKAPQGKGVLNTLRTTLPTHWSGSGK
jgi:maltose operon periplasmic protein